MTNKYFKKQRLELEKYSLHELPSQPIKHSGNRYKILKVTSSTSRTKKFHCPRHFLVLEKEKCLKAWLLLTLKKKSPKHNNLTSQVNSTARPGLKNILVYSFHHGSDRISVFKKIWNAVRNMLLVPKPPINQVTELKHYIRNVVK